jgi:hypothetical protein
MTAKRRKYLALIAGTLSISTFIGMLVIAAMNDSVDEVSITGAMGVVYAAVGWILVTRTNHVIGWLFFLISVSFPLGTLMEQWAEYGTKTCPGCLPVFAFFFVPGTLVWVAGTMAIPLVFLLFPSGKASEPHGRRIARVFVAAMAVVALTLILRPSDPGAAWPNPYGLEALRAPLLVVFGIAVGVALLSAAAAIGGLFVRFRRARGIERQQMKWLVFVGIAAATMLLLVILPVSFVQGDRQTTVGDLIWLMFFTLLMVGIPVSVGFAILRYRLYDIDRLISRTVSYAIISLILVGFYALVAVVIPAALFGDADTPDAVIAVATLAALAAFGPVRRRVQSRVDHRFNRARYDAETTFGMFTTRMREQVDIDLLGAELRSVVGLTMEPTHVSLWLRDP